MKTITPGKLLEEIELGAELIPQESDCFVGVRVGRFDFLCDLRAITKEQRTRFIELYRQCRIKFGFPGDFQLMPFFFKNQQSRTRLGRIRLWDVFSRAEPVIPEVADFQPDDAPCEVHPLDLLDYAVGK